MNNADDIKALRLRFLEAWGSLTPVVVGVEESDQPDQAYCVVDVMPNIETRLTIGADPDYEAKGIVWCDILSPIADKDEAAWNLADHAANIFRDWQSSDGRIRCETPSFRNASDAGKFMHLIVTVPYRARH